MNMNTERKTVELLSLVDKDTGVALVPEGIIAAYGADNGPCQIRGKLINHGTITITGGKHDKVVFIAHEIVNTGKLETEVGSLSLGAKSLENNGEINGGDLIKLVGTTGRFRVTGDGSIKASKKLDIDGRMGVTVSGGTYMAPSIEFNAEHGNVSVSADVLDGEVTANAKAAKIGAKTGMLNIGPNRLLSGNHVYYNANGNVSLGSINHGTDNVAILASGDVSVSGNITAGDLFIGAGIGFTINGQYPNPIQDNDADVSWAATTLGYGTVDVGGTITTSQWLTINGGYITLNDLTIGNSVLIDTPGGNGEFTVEGDIDVEHTFTVKAFYIDLQGDDFDVEEEIFLGNDGKSGYTTIAGTFKASKSVTFKSQEVKFDGTEFTMDGEDEDDKLITDANVKIDATDGISIKGDVETNRPVNLLFFCDADVATGSITIDNSTGSWAGTLAIKANRNGGSSQFVIGGEDETNGVNGTIITDTVDGGSTSTDTFWQGGVYISNHGDGGIKLTNATDISVKGTNSACGGIILDADDGTIELPAGTLSADGTGNFAGAVIQLLADTLETEDGTIISASDNGESGKAKNVQISVDTINLTGSSGLTIRCDGGGNGTYKTALQIVPKGCVVLNDSDEPSYFVIWSYLNAGEGSIPGSVNFEGGTSAPLNVSANGSHSRIAITGYPVVFNTGDTIIECKGAEDHQIQMIKYGSSGSDGLQFNGGDVTIDASAASEDDGDGGTIEINIDHILRTNTGKTTIKADGHGSGNGGQIDFSPGEVENPVLIGLSDEQFSFSAKGGNTDGDGGTINLNGWTASFEVHGASDTTTPIDVSAPGGEGNGGTIYIVAYGGDGLVFDGSASFLSADSGTSSGNGGRITILAADAPIEISTDEEGSVSISAISNGDGDGGTIDITAWGGLTVNSANIFATADGSGTGGNISLSAGYSTFTLNGELNADGGENDGEGGVIELEGGEIVVPEDGTFTASTKGNGAGNGGEVHVTTNWGKLDMGTDGAIYADGGDSGGDGGTISIAYGSIWDELTVGTLSAIGTSETGGTVSIESTGAADLVVNAGLIDTNASESEDPDGLAGSTNLAVSDDETYSIMLNIADELGGFNSILSAEAKNVSFAALPAVNLGVDTIRANDGDVTICADGSGSCVVAVTGARPKSSSTNNSAALLQTQSSVGVIQIIEAPNGGVTISCERLYSKGNPSADNTVILPGNDKPVSLSCNELALGPNSFVYGSQFANGNIALQSRGQGLTIKVPNGSTCGFKSANDVTIVANVGVQETLLITSADFGSGILSLEGDTCNIIANGSITTEGVRLGYFDNMTGVIDSTLTPTELSISSVDSSIQLGSQTIAVAKMSIKTFNTSSGNIGVSTTVAGSSTSPGEIEINAAKGLVIQSSTVQCSGPITMEAQDAILANSNSHIKTLASGGLSPEKITIQSLADIGFLSGTQVISNDEIMIASTASASKHHPDNSTNRPSTVNPATQVHITSPGQLYWGDKTHLDINSDNSPQFTANEKDLAFDASIGDILIGSNTVFTAGA